VTDEERMRMLDKVYGPARQVLENMGLRVEGVQDVSLTADGDWVDDRKQYTVTIRATVQRG
jgi:hypothetical protein